MEQSPIPPSGKSPKPLFGDHEPFEQEDFGSGRNPFQGAGFSRDPLSTYEQREAEYAAIGQLLNQSNRTDTVVLRPKPMVDTAWFRVAAAVTVLVVAVALLWWFRQPAQTELATGPTETRHLVLPDQSVVYLNANSRLTFHNQWAENQPREVWLEGEAFFTVTKQVRAGRQVKFVVHTQDLDVEVLGTRFNVRQQAQRTRVVLQSGKVQLVLHQEEPKQVPMQPGDLVEYSAKDGQLVQKLVNPQPYVAWKDQQWRLDNLTVQEIATLLEETAGVHVTIADSSIADLRLGGSLRSRDVTLILNALTIAHEIQWEREGNQIVLRSKSSQ